MQKNEFIISGSNLKPILLDQTSANDVVPNGVVVFCHGFKGFKDWGHFNKVAEEFAKAGLIFVKFNFSHNGTTPDTPTEFSDLEAFGNNNFSKELDDLDTVINWVVKDSSSLGKGLPLFLMGHSRGGGIVILKASEDKRVSRVVTWATVGDFGKRLPADLDVYKKDGVLFIPNARTNQQMPIYYQFAEDYFINEERFNLNMAFGRLQIPALLIHGDRDEAVHFLESENLSRKNKKAKFLLLKGEGHTFGAGHPFNDSILPSGAKEVVKASMDFFL